jgi:hypothetical protein
MKTDKDIAILIEYFKRRGQGLLETLQGKNLGAQKRQGGDSKKGGQILVTIFKLIRSSKSVITNLNTFAFSFGVW